MPGADVEKVVELVRTLSRAEQWRLRDLLEIWLAPPEGPLTEEEFEQELLKEGVLDHVPPPITDVGPYEGRTPIDVKGRPASEILVEERR